MNVKTMEVGTRKTAVGSRRPGSALVSSAGEGVSPSRTFSGNAPSRSDLIRARAQRMVRSGQARNYSHACSLLSKRAAGSRRRKANNLKTAQEAWWQK